jgi:DNA-binding IclR family transcriptional regulator
MKDSDGAARAPHSQTLDRGLRVLEALADAGAPMSIGDLAERLGVHRSIAYRIVRTLEDHRLVRRRRDGACELGVGLSVLARGVAHTLQSAALPELSDLANDLGMTAFLVVADLEEAVTLISVEPRHSSAHVAYRPGVRHPIERGAPGIALLSASPPRPDERREVDAARRAGYASSRGEVLRGMSAVAAPVTVPGRGVLGALAVVYVETGTAEEELGRRVGEAARAVAADLA